MVYVYFAINCWAIVLAFVIGARYLIKQIHKTRDWMLSTQDLVDNLIRFYGDEIPTNDDGSIIIGPHNTYPARMSTALKYCIHQGLAFESDYPYTGTRDTSDLPKPIKVIFYYDQVESMNIWVHQLILLLVCLVLSFTGL